jgi:hypothetical protein
MGISINLAGGELYDATPAFGESSGSSVLEEAIS